MSDRERIPLGFRQSGISVMVERERRIAAAKAAGWRVLEGEQQPVTNNLLVGRFYAVGPEVQIAEQKKELEGKRFFNEMAAWSAIIGRLPAPLDPELELRTLEWAATKVSDPEGVFVDESARREHPELFVSRCREAVASICPPNGEFYSIGDGWLMFWRCYCVCRVANIDVPPWILHYFDHVALELFRLKENDGLWKGFVKKAGKILRRGGAFKTKKQLDTDNAALMVEDSSALKKSILQDAAYKFGVGKRSIERAMTEHRKDKPPAGRRRPQKK